MFKLWALALIFPLQVFAFEQRFIFDNYVYGEWQHPELASVNPGNAVLLIPDREGVVDLRPDWTLRSDELKFVVRPRWIGRAFEWSELGTSHAGANGQWNLMDAYVEYRPRGDLRVVGGLEVYQWGPAELMNASNPLFHLRTNSQSVFFKEKGKVLIRVTYDQDENWNHMAVFNPVSNNEEPFRYDQRFQSTGFVKTEVRAKSGWAYAGALTGTEDDGLPFIGEYGQIGFESGWSLYVDARETFGNHTYIPQTNTFGYVEMDQAENSQTVTQGISGVRWEGRVDARGEFYWNSAGYDPNQFHQAIQSIQLPSPWLASNFNRVLQPGLELPGRYYSYLSLRIPDLGPRKDIAIAFRDLNSLQDGSGTGQLTFEKPASDSVVLEFESDVAYGGVDRELTMASSYQIVAGLKWTL